MTDITEHLTWTPEPGQKVTFWDTSGGPEEREDVALAELVLTLPRGPIDVRFEVDRDTFLRMQSRRWFGVPLRFTETLGVAFAEEGPVTLHVRSTPIDDGGLDIEACYDGIVEPPGDPQATLAEIARAFTAPVLEDYDPVISPFSYRLVRAAQVGADGAGVSFTGDDIAAWERGGR